MKHFMVNNSVQYCYADVMCKLWKFAKEREPDLTHKLLPALSVMHAKGHALDCQVSISTIVLIIIFLYPFENFH